MALPSGNTDPEEDLFNLSILAALAHRLLNAQLHPNMGEIASGLGQRLLLATRKWASVRLSNTAQPVMDMLNTTVSTDTPTRDPVYDLFADQLASGTLPLSFDFAHLGGPFPFVGGDFDFGLGADADYTVAMGMQ
jgi:hypothetical protein